MLKLDNLISPHFGKNIIYSGSDIKNAKNAIFLIHGRGGTAESMLGLTDELNLVDTIIIAPQADDFTWYPYRFIEKREMNEPGISSGLQLIDSIKKSLNQNGIKSENIFLLGFSQGACLALDYAARNPEKYGGVFALSGGLIGDIINKNDYVKNLQNTPIFLGCSDIDFHIPLERVSESADVFSLLGADVTKRIYKNMGHTINQDELEIINNIISKHQKVIGVSYE